jgi:flagellar hook-associated protein 3 FlgL
MVSRIATAFQNQTTLRNLQASNAELSLTTYQISTGNKARVMSDVSGDASRILSLRDVHSRNKVYVEGMNNAENQLKSVEAALQSMTDLLEDAAQTATLGRNENSAATRATLAPKAKSLADTFYNLLNTQFQDRYVFSGQDGLNKPVSGVATATAFPGVPLPTTWYEGDTSQNSVITGANAELNYGVVGNDPALVKMKAGLESLWYGLQNNSIADMDSAITILKEARTDLSTALGAVGGQMNTINQISERTSTQNVFIKEQLDGLEKVDVAEAITLFGQQQTTLQASFQIIAQVNQLSLLNFLR